METLRVNRVIVIGDAGADEVGAVAHDIWPLLSNAEQLALLGGYRDA